MEEEGRQEAGEGRAGEVEAVGGTDVFALEMEAAGENPAEDVEGRDQQGDEDGGFEEEVADVLLVAADGGDGEELGEDGEEDREGEEYGGGEQDHAAKEGEALADLGAEMDVEAAQGQAEKGDGQGEVTVAEIEVEVGHFADDELEHEGEEGGGEDQGEELEALFHRGTTLVGIGWWLALGR